MKKIVSLVLLFSILMFNTSVSFAEEDENCPFHQVIDCSDYSGLNAALRSLLMPGWGQGWNEQYTKGWITFGIFAVSVFGYFYFNNKSESDYKKYEENGSINGSKYSDYENDRNISMTCGIVALATWTFAVVDAYLVANNKSKHYALSKKLSLLAYNKDGAMVKYNLKF